MDRLVAVLGECCKKFEKTHQWFKICFVLPWPRIKKKILMSSDLLHTRNQPSACYYINHLPTVENALTKGEKGWDFNIWQETNSPSLAVLRVHFQ